MSDEAVFLGSDGRDLDPRLADVSGIGSSQRPDPHGPDRAMPGAGEPVWHPRRHDAGAATYYGQPIVKAPPWGPKVSAYIVLGGLAGSSAALAAATEVFGGDALHRTAKVATLLAAGTASAGAVLLMADLGRPERFLNMVRVVRPTSVMNVGGYLLSATAGAAAAASLLNGRSGAVGVVGRVATVAAGTAGMPLSGYTGVLLAGTAIPGWNVGMKTLPPLFMASGAATAGSLLRMAPLGDAGQRTVGAVTVLAQAAELAAGAAHDRVLRDRPHVHRYYDAAPGWRLGTWLTGASMLLGLLPTRRTVVGRWAAGALGAAGSTLTKTAVFDAGMASARDPLAVAESPSPVAVR